MSYGSFEKLVVLLQESLAVQQDMAALHGGAILPELCVYVTLWYLAGGSYTDIFYLVGISQLSFYHVIQTRGSWSVQQDLHLLAQTMPCVNVSLF